MAHATCLVCFIGTVNGRSKIKENALEDVALVAGTQQNLSNLYSLDIYVQATCSKPQIYFCETTIFSTGIKCL
jgi:hypothetical protein